MHKNVEYEEYNNDTMMTIAMHTVCTEQVLKLKKQNTKCTAKTLNEYVQRKQAILFVFGLSICRDDNEYTEQALLTELNKTKNKNKTVVENNEDTTEIMMMMTMTTTTTDQITCCHCLWLRLLPLLLPLSYQMVFLQ